MKTYEQFAAFLGEDNLKKFETNITKRNDAGIRLLNEWKSGIVPVTKFIIADAFSWIDTPEGQYFWQKKSIAWVEECDKLDKLTDLFDKRNLDYEYEYSLTENQEQFFFFNKSQFVKAQKLVADFAEQVESEVSHYTADFNYTDKDEEGEGEMALFVTYM